MPRVFISHSTQDRAFVEGDLLRLLKKQDLETWYATDDIVSGDLFNDRIREGLRACDWFLIVLSPNSQQSAWVKSELHWAMEHREGRIVPVMLTGCDTEAFHIGLPRIQYVDFTRPDRASANARLLAAFNAGAKPKTEARPSPPRRASHRGKILFLAALVGVGLLMVAAMFIASFLSNRRRNEEISGERPKQSVESVEAPQTPNEPPSPPINKIPQFTPGEDPPQPDPTPAPEPPPIENETVEPPPPPPSAQEIRLRILGDKNETIQAFRDRPKGVVRVDLKPGMTGTKKGYDKTTSKYQMRLDKPVDDAESVWIDKAYVEEY